MTRSSSLVFVLVATLVAGLTITAWASPARAAQQSGPQLETLIEFTLDDSEVPPVASAIRLLRITLAPGAKSPLHTHPGPEFQLIESGTIKTIAEGKALWDQRDSRQATPTAGPVQAPDGEFIMRSGGSIVFIPGTAMTFRNTGSKDAVILAAVIQPWGNQAPPSIVYVGQAPTDADFKGVTSTILGDGYAPELPPGQVIVRIERMTLKAGEAIPATTVPTMLSLEDGSFDFKVQDGSVQVSRTANPGLQPEAAAGTTFSLDKGDAAFFPYGNAEADRSADKGTLTLLRMTISPVSAEEAATPVAGQQAVIEMTAPPTPSPTPEPTATATAAASPSPTSTEITEGATVVVTGDTVNLRSGPSTTASIVGQVTKGQVLTVTGPSQQGDNYTWWPVQDANDASIAGFIASDFIEVQQ